MRCLSYSFLPTNGPILLLLLLLPLLCVTSLSPVTIDFRTSECNNASTYTDGGTYSSNLDTVLNHLILNGSQSGFNTSSYGQSPDKVYGLLQCIGNISAQDCSNCSQQARSRLQAYCPNDIGGQVWMTYCFLRYDNSTFFSELDTKGQYLTNTQDVTNGAEAFKSVKFELLTNLSKTTTSPASKRFAIGNATYSASDTVYGLVQCLRDISTDNCSTCLTSAIQGLESCCSRAQGAQGMLGSCTARYEIYPFYEPAMSASSPPSSSPEGSPPPSNGTLPLPKTSKKSSKALPIILGISGGVVLLLIICLFALRGKLKSAFFGKPVTAVADRRERRDYSSEAGLLSEEQNFLFSLETLIEATQNFHPDNKLGEGGFGAVYRGTTKEGKDIAVKKLSASSSQGKNEFMNEVKLMANIQHRNLVRLLGCCVEGDERLLVYEYLPNKSLDNFIFDQEQRKQLDWEKRYNIIVGIARGLLYLHEDSQLRVIHRDIKANNILLDDRLNPKIADFGLARLFPEDQTHIQTRVAGTYGYMAPEYAMRGQLSVKADVYSFGVLLLEIVCGRKNTDNDLSPEKQNLLEWVWKIFKSGDVLSMVDSMVIKTCSQEQAQRCIHVGLLCVQSDAGLRPAVSNVLMMISSNSVTLSNPTKPAFVNSPNRSPESTSSPSPRLPQDAKNVSSETSGIATSPSSGFPSVNDTSVSEVNPR